MNLGARDARISLRDVEEGLQPTYVLRFGPFEADLEAGQLRKNGVRVKLPQQPFQVLVCLLERPGRVVTREALIAELWPTGTVVEYEHSLGTAINKIRQALDDSAHNPEFVETLPRRGYRFLVPVERIGRPSEECPPRVAALAPQPSATISHYKITEKLEGQENPRYGVTSLDADGWPAQRLYEELYCARGEMENRIKEQLSLFADRMSTQTLRANQLRLRTAHPNSPPFSPCSSAPSEIVVRKAG